MRDVGRLFTRNGQTTTKMRSTLVDPSTRIALAILVQEVCRGDGDEEDKAAVNRSVVWLPPVGLGSELLGTGESPRGAVLAAMAPRRDVSGGRHLTSAAAGKGIVAYG